MKKKAIIFQVLVLSLSMALLSCKSDSRQITADMINFPPAEGEAGTGKIPVIQFDSTTMNFGTIAIGEKVNHSFKFKNTGKAALIISQVTPSCGCTTPKDWPKHPIFPGEEGQISVEFNSSDFPGQIEKSISVLTNAIPATFDLKLKGNVSGEKGNDAKFRYEMDMEMK